MNNVVIEQPFWEYLEDMINRSGIRQNEISDALDLPKSNIITMYKQNRTRMPIIRVPAMARILKLDVANMVNRWFKTYEPEQLAVIEETFGMSLSKNEKEIIKAMREFAGDADLAMKSTKSKEALREFVKSMVS